MDTGNTGLSNNLMMHPLGRDVVDEVPARADTFDLNDSIPETPAYDGFDTSTNDTGITANGRYQWTEGEFDAETGLQYNRGRYYLAEIARWLSEDPMGFEAGDANLYRYVGNGPTNLRDPSGRVANPFQWIVDVFFPIETDPMLPGSELAGSPQRMRPSSPLIRPPVQVFSPFDIVTLARPVRDPMQRGPKVVIEFRPGASPRVGRLTCETIAIAQAARILVDGHPIKPGDYDNDWTYRDAVTTSAFWFIDHERGATTPDYQQGGGKGDRGIGGYGNAPALPKNDTIAWISDFPFADGGDKGFFHKTQNPNGWKRVTYEFQVVAYSMNKQTGKAIRFFEGISWSYTRRQDDTVGGEAVLPVQNPKTLVFKYSDQPSRAFLQAFNKFLQVHNK
jgi:RHS repeat-associated protein